MRTRPSKRRGSWRSGRVTTVQLRPMAPCRRFFPVRIVLLRFRLLQQLIAQLPACRARRDRTRGAIGTISREIPPCGVSTVYTPTTVCHERTDERKCGAVQEMEAGPPESAVRG